MLNIISDKKNFSKISRIDIKMYKIQKSIKREKNNKKVKIW
jgi:hypothetical protein